VIAGISDWNVKAATACGADTVPDNNIAVKATGSVNFDMQFFIIKCFNLQ